MRHLHDARMTAPAAATPLPVSLVRLAAPAAAAVAKKGRIPLPTDLLICPWGKSKDLAGNDVIVDELTVSELAANQSLYGFDEVALDFGHNTTPPVDAEGRPQKAPEPLPIAAMGKLSVLSGKGIIFTPTSWTPEGEHYYTGRHYKDLSPTVGKTPSGQVNFVHSVALTRAGQIANLHAFATATLPALTTLQTSPPIMDTPDYRALLVQSLKLEDSATDEQIIAAMATAPAAPETTELAAPPANVIPLATPATPELTALAARMDSMEKTNLVAEATRAGKLIPLSAESIALTPLAVLADMIAKIPAGTIPLSAGPTPAAPLPALKALSAEETAVAARMGYTAEQWRAANPA